jgi:hypothetical protein
MLGYLAIVEVTAHVANQHVAIGADIIIHQKLSVFQDCL